MGVKNADKCLFQLRILRDQYVFAKGKLLRKAGCIVGKLKREFTIADKNASPQAGV
jgi:hypothetical protein